MLPKDELKTLQKILSGETYHIPIQKEVEKKDTVKRHQPKETDTNLWKELFDDKVLGILGG